MSEARNILRYCCAGCVVPAGIFKAVQVASGLALPKDIVIIMNGMRSDIMNDQKCPVCGRQGQNVPLTAVENLLKEESRNQVKDGGYCLCTNPECRIVYYDPELGRVFDQNALRIKVWLKDTGDDVPLCYCRNITRGQVKAAWQSGARTYSDVVKAVGVEQEKCNCQYENPAGKCCSGTIKDYLDELDLLHKNISPSVTSNDEGSC